MTHVQFAPATKAQAKLRAALFGPSGSGKTFSALRIAHGIGGKVALIDTEFGSAAKYAPADGHTLCGPNEFLFDTIRLDPSSGRAPTIDNITAALQAAAGAGYDVVIVDSLTHAWEELKDEVSRVAKAQFGGNTWAAWSVGTPMQRAFVEALLAAPFHLIATMRVSTEWQTGTDDRGKFRVVRVGLKPEQGKNIEYEFDLLVELSADHVATVIKDRTGRFQDRVIEKPDEAFGRDLAAWLAEGTPPQPQDAPPADPQAPAPQASPPAQAIPPAAPPDLSRLKTLIDEHGLTEEQQAAWCRHFKVETLDRLTQKQVDAVVAKIERSIAKGA